MLNGPLGIEKTGERSMGENYGGKILRALGFLAFLAPIVLVVLSAPSLNDGHWDMLWVKISAATFGFSLLMSGITAFNK